MIFKEHDRNYLRCISSTTLRTNELVEDLSALRNGDHDEVTAKLDSIEHSIEALATKIDTLTQLATGATDTFQDLGNALKAIRDLSKADSEVNNKQFRAIVAGVELIVDKLGCNSNGKKTPPTGDISTMFVNIMEELVNLKFMYAKLEQLVVFEASATKRYNRRTRGYHPNRIRAGYARRYARMFANEGLAKREKYYDGFMID